MLIPLSQELEFIHLRVRLYLIIKNNSNDNMLCGFVDRVIFESVFGRISCD